MNDKNTHRQGTFYKFPKVLLDEKISIEAKIIYMVMLDLEQLSIKNEKGFSDENGTYIIMTLETVQDILNCGEPKAQCH